MTTTQLPAETTSGSRLLTAAEFHRLADVPPEAEWFANLSNPSTRRAYEDHGKDSFHEFTQEPPRPVVTASTCRAARKAAAPAAC